MLQICDDSPITGKDNKDVVHRKNRKDYIDMRSEKIKNIILDIAYDIIGSFFYAVGVYTFAKMANFAPGGVTGIALIMNYLWNLPIGTMSLVLNIPLMLLSLKFLGKEFLLKSN